MTTIKEVNNINRFQEIPYDGIVCDLVWSDPLDDNKAVTNEFMDNPER